MKKCKISKLPNINQWFSPNRPLGRFGLVVAMSICLSVYLSVPFHIIFVLPPWTGAEGHLSMDWCGASVALAWSPKNRDVFQNGRIIPPPSPPILQNLLPLDHPVGDMNRTSTTVMYLFIMRIVSIFWLTGSPCQLFDWYSKIMTARNNSQFLIASVNKLISGWRWSIHQPHHQQRYHQSWIQLHPWLPWCLPLSTSPIFPLATSIPSSKASSPWTIWEEDKPSACCLPPGSLWVCYSTTANSIISLDSLCFSELRDLINTSEWSTR